MGIFQYFKLITLYLVSSFLVGLLGFLIAPSIGEWVALSVYFIFILSLHLIGDRLFLGLIGAKKFSDRKTRTIVNNTCSKARVANVEIYTTSDFPVDIYPIMATKKRPYLVIGERLREILSEEEFKAVLIANVQDFQNGSCLLRSHVAIPFFIFYLPFLLMRPISNSTTGRVITEIVLYYLAPFEYLVRLMIKNPKKIIERDLLVARKYKIGDELSSALFKMGQYITPQHKKFTGKIIEIFAFADTGSGDEFRKYSRYGISTDARYQRLRM